MDIGDTVTVHATGRRARIVSRISHERFQVEYLVDPDVTRSTVIPRNRRPRAASTRRQSYSSPIRRTLAGRACTRCQDRPDPSHHARASVQ